MCGMISSISSRSASSIDWEIRGDRVSFCILASSFMLWLQITSLKLRAGELISLRVCVIASRACSRLISPPRSGEQWLSGMNWTGGGGRNCFGLCVALHVKTCWLQIFLDWMPMYKIGLSISGGMASVCSTVYESLEVCVVVMRGRVEVMRLSLIICRCVGVLSIGVAGV
jgi:hypothetical protein